jgi:hypothetical protein
MADKNLQKYSTSPFWFLVFPIIVLLLVILYGAVLFYYPAADDANRVAVAAMNAATNMRR